MLALDDIDRIVNGAALAGLKTVKPRRVVSSPSVDSEGRAALHVVIVLPDKSAPRIDGKMALDTIVNVQRDLQTAGEERFAVVDFATEDEMRQDVGP